MNRYSNAKHSYKKKSHKLKLLERILLIIFIILLLFSSYKIMLWLRQNKEQKKLIENLIENVVTKNDLNDFKQEDIEVDFKKLKNMNDETIAWIKIDEINLSTPIVQTTNNDYYLEYNFNKQKNKCGTLFMDCKNNKDFTSPNTVIYGHNLYTGMMFGDLKQIFNGEHGNDIKIHIYTPNKNLNYKIFSAYQEEPNLNIIAQNITEKYIQNLKAKSKINFGEIPSNITNIVTLVTCDGTGIGRIAVHGYLVE